MITPAISVLSALEGVNVATDRHTTARSPEMIAQV
jgi:K+ transporter